MVNTTLQNITEIFRAVISNLTPGPGESLVPGVELDQVWWYDLLKLPYLGIKITILCPNMVILEGHYSHKCKEPY